MKKFKFNFICLLLAASVAMQSCTDDMDVVSEDDDVLSPEQLYSTPQGYKMGLAGLYGNLSMTGTSGSDNSFLQGIDAGTSNFGRCLWYLQDLTTDEAIWSYENDAGVADIQRMIWSSDNPILLGMFSRTMAEVALVNSFLRQSTPELLAARGITDPADVADIEDYRNEARALRAYAYYVMMDLFGKAPYIALDAPINSMGPEYNSEQLFEYVETELTEVLPLLKDARTNEYGRLDKAFAQMVLAKMYLNAEVYTDGPQRYADCLQKCTELIGGGYSLKPNYLHNFAADNNTSAEMIFTLQSDGTFTQAYGVTTVLVNGQIGEWEANGADFGVGGWGGALRVRKQLVQKFDGGDFDFDARKTFGTGIAGNPNRQRPIDITTVSARTQGYILNKWSNKTSAGIPGESSAFVDTDFPLFRLADVYLMYAEAHLRGGGGTLADAVGYVNQLRERANGNTSANITSGQLTLDFILDERARELHWESHRRQDLIRFGKYTGGSYNWAWKGNAAGGVAVPAFRKLFPIPADALNTNTNLTQNTGY